MSEHYVVVCENDKPSQFDGKVDPHGEIVFEQYLKDASLEECKKFIKQLNGRYGKCRIAKLEFTSTEIEKNNE